MYCSNCGGTLPYDAQFCHVCGAGQANLTPAQPDAEPSDEQGNKVGDETGNEAPEPGIELTEPSSEPAEPDTPLPPAAPKNKAPFTRKKWGILLAAGAVVVVLLVVLVVVGFGSGEFFSAKESAPAVVSSTSLAVPPAQSAVPESEAPVEEPVPEEEMPQEEVASSSMEQENPSGLPINVTPLEKMLYGTIKADGGLHLRTGPGQSYESYGLIPKESEVLIWGSSVEDPNWWYIEYNGYRGFAHAEYIQAVL